MKLDRSTLYIDFIPFENCLTDESEKELSKAVFSVFPPYLSLSIHELFQCLRGDFSIIKYDESKEITAFQAFWIKHFQTWLEDFVAMIERYNIPPTGAQKRASEKCLKQKFEESVLIFCREYFGLHSFKAVYDLPITDYILAKRDSYNKAVYERALAEYTAQQYKVK